MNSIELDDVIRVCRQFAMDEFGDSVADSDLEVVVRSVLYPPRDLLEAQARGLVTQAEVAAAVAAHVYSWLMNRSGRAWQQENAARDWNLLVKQISEAIFA